MLLLLAACESPGSVDEGTGDSACPDLPDPCADGVSATVTATIDLLPPVAVPHGPVSITVGDLASVGTNQVYVGTNTTVTRLDDDEWSVATDLWVQPDDGTALFPLVADLTGDGTPDLLIGLPGSDAGSGQVLVFPGPVSEPVDWDSNHYELKGGGGLGFDPATGDFDGDGQLDLLVNGNGFAMIKRGPFDGDASLDPEVDTLLQGPADAPSLFATAANLDGDGVSDIVYSLMDAPTCLDYGTRLGTASGPLGPGLATLAELPSDAGQAFYTLYDNAAGSQRGAPPLAADADGDGLDDLVVYALSTEFHPASPIVAALYPSPVGTRDPVYFGLASQVSLAGLTQTGALLRELGDLDSDGKADLFLGGAILAGPLADLPPPDRDTCTVAYDYGLSNLAGSLTTSWLGDLDGDGDNDLVITGDGDNNDGAVQILLGPAAI